MRRVMAVAAALVLVLVGGGAAAAEETPTIAQPAPPATRMVVDHVVGWQALWCGAYRHHHLRHWCWQPDWQPSPLVRPARWSCTTPLGGSCGPYSYPRIAASNGFNTYVANQSVGPQPGTAQTVYANSPGDWQVVADARPYGYRGVQTFPDVQQLWNDWCGSATNWGSCPAPTDTPINSLRSLVVRYAETSPTGRYDLYQFSPDLWLDNYRSDIMFWVDVKGRCNPGAFGGTVLGHAVIDRQRWTVHRYGGPGAEIIFVLDGRRGSGTCAQQHAGTINVKAGVGWLVAHHIVTGAPVMSQLNTGWEITSARHATFRVTRYGVTVG